MSFNSRYEIQENPLSKVGPAYSKSIFTANYSTRYIETCQQFLIKEQHSAVKQTSAPHISVDQREVYFCHGESSFLL